MTVQNVKIFLAEIQDSSFSPFSSDYRGGVAKPYKNLGFKTING